MHNYFRRHLTAWKETDVKKDGAGAREPGCVWQTEREKKGKPNAELLMRETRHSLNLSGNSQCETFFFFKSKAVVCWNWSLFGHALYCSLRGAQLKRWSCVTKGDAQQGRRVHRCCPSDIWCTLAQTRSWACINVPIRHFSECKRGGRLCKRQ